MVVVTSLTRRETDDQQAAKALALVEGAALLVAAGDHVNALAAYRIALATYEMLSDADPGNAAWQRGLAVSHDLIGNMLAAGGDRDGALAEYRAAFAITKKLAASLTAAGDRESAALAAHRADLAIRKIRRFDAAYPGLSPYIRREKLNKNSELLRQNPDLVSEQDVQNSSPMPGETNTPAGERGSPRLRHTSPLPEARHEVTRPAETQQQSVSAEARILFGDLPASLRPRRYVKRNAPPTQEDVQAAFQVLNRYETLKKAGHEFTKKEIDAMRAAHRVKYSFRKFGKLAFE